jgi:lipid II:glycine glycyltransferase (peptidoglycan interpeptide bridge formation enzyme)
MTRVLNSLEETVWRRFVDEHPQGNVFHTPEMFQVFAQAKSYRPTLWATMSDNGKVLALLLPVQIALMRGVFQRLTSRAVAYGSVLCAAGVESRQALVELLQAHSHSVKSQVLFTELRNLSDMSDIQATLEAQGFVYEEHLNYLIALNRSLNDVMQSIGSRTRKNIRRGLRRGQVVIEEVSRLEQVTVCYELLAKTYAQAQVPLADRSLFEAAFKVLYPKDMVKFLLAQVDDAYIATSVELIYKDVIYGWYGGTDRRYSQYVPNELLMWHILSWGVENGYRLYDFGGAGKPDEDYGVRNFKAKFGGKLVCFGRNTCVHTPRLLWLSEQGYRIMRRWL